MFATFLILFSALRAEAMPRELELVVARAHEISASGGTPMVISDLDETLIDSTTRRYQALRDSLPEACAEVPAAACGALKGINIAEQLALPNRYDLEPLLDLVKFPQGGARQRLLNATVDKYLSGRHIELDQAVPGALDLVHQLQNAGAEIYYVSARSDAKQRAGTIDNLHSLGFIRDGEDTRVILKPQGMSSIEFKRSTFERLRKLASMNRREAILVMENEPENMNAFTETFPDALGVFVEGAFLKPEPVRGKVLRLRSFR